jgi:hypothetical protein
MRRHYSFLGKRPASMPLDSAAARPDLTARGVLRFSAAAARDDESLVVHLSSLVDDGGGRCSANGVGAGLRLDRRVLRCRTAWMSQSLVQPRRSLLSSS